MWIWPKGSSNREPVGGFIMKFNVFISEEAKPCKWCNLLTKTGFTVWYGQPAAGWAAAAFFCKPSRLQQVITVNNTFNLAMPCCGKSLAPCRHGLSGHGCSQLSSSQVSARIMKNTNRVPLYVVSHSAFSLIPLILTSPFFTSFLSLLSKMPIFSFSLCLSLAPTLYPLLRLSPAL